MSAIADSIIARVDTERSTRAIVHALDNGLPPDEIAALIAHLDSKMNWGRPRDPATDADRELRKSFVADVREIMAARGLKGEDARESVVEEILPNYSTRFQKRRRYTLNAALHDVQKGVL